ncbi:InlB B-repeat-containing protein [[Clostridium] hylemonae]|uniref:InlB B-repeat-containing protein n=1 Tax=[Clostridium] hylemonae TaxID=89153 RepID=UPI001106B5E8|nr:InlB B-repeat-containing protein [[Clostridium] hylemonae]
MGKKNFRKLKILLMAGAIAALVFTAGAGEALAVGIHVDENAAETGNDGQKAQEDGTAKEQEESGGNTDKTGQEEAPPAGQESIELVQGDTPALRALKDAAEGKTNLRQVMLSERLTASSVRAVPGAFDISEGDITLSENGGYEQKNKLDTIVSTGTKGDEQFTVTGNTGEYGIRIKSGASATIQVQGMKINMTPDAPKKSGIYIEAGAKVTLVLGTDDTLVSGTNYMPGITLEPGATLNITGAGVLDVTGGAGADGISGTDNAQGGTLKVEGEARLHVYSDQESACNVKVSSISNKILQGTLETPVSMDAPTNIQAENKNKRTEKYPMTLPAGHRSFAVSTTADGGEYVSYFPGADGNVQSSHLLVDAAAPARHSYNLTGAGNTFAALRNLKDQEVAYTVIFHANGGTFHETENEKLIFDGSKKVKYGELITGAPGNADVERNAHTLLGWYRIQDSAEDSDKWNFDRDQVVKDNMTLYATWKPDSCTVIYRSGNRNVMTKDGYAYKDTIEKADSWKPGSDYNPGYTLVYWQTDDGKRWEFGAGGTQLTKATTVLTAVWLQDCTVTFDPNAGGEEITGWPRKTTVPATWLVSRPDEKPLRAGYRFTNWYKDKACTQEWDFDTDTAKGAKMTLYAGWGAETTIVTFHVDTDAGEMVTPTTLAVGFGNTIDEPSASKPKRTDKLTTEYEVEGWYTDDRPAKKWDFSTELIDPDGDFHLYAKWRQKTCYAVLSPGDKDAAPQEEIPKAVPYGSTLETQYGADGLDDVFTKKGHKITGWRTPAGKLWGMDEPLTEDVSLKAQWEAEVYDVKFETPADAPELPDNEKMQQVVFNRTVQAPAYPETDDAWPGHTFLGWNTEADGSGTDWIFSGEAGATLVEEPVTLYAQWQWDEYTVSFHTYAGDENPPPDQSGIHYGENVSVPAEPAREHYDFLGWFTDEEHTHLWDFDADTVTGDMVLYAGWEGNLLDVTLHVTYEPEHAEHPGEEVAVTPAEDIRYGDFLDRDMLESLEETKHRDGYTLNGWFTSPDHAAESEWKFADMRAEPADEQLDLYAYWTWDEYTVTFVTYDGDEENNIPPVQGVHFGEKITRPENDPVREHYEFDDWYADLEAEDKTPWNFGTDTVKGDMNLYAGWIPDVYTLSFETNGGTPLDPVQVTYGTYVDKELLKTKRTGYELTGWYKDPGLTEAFAPESEYVDRDMTIYAAWELEKFTVRLHYREDKDSQEEEVTTYTKVYQVGDYIAKPDKAIPHKTLSSWFTAPDWQKEHQWVFKRDKVAGDTDLYAYWSDTLYKVHFETYGGTEIEDKELPWGSLLEAPEAPEHDGCVFGGWFKDAEYKTAWDFEEDFVDGNTTVYAKWKPNTYTVTFDAAGGTGGPAAQKLPYGSLIPEPAAPVREGYVLTGWKSSEGGDWNFAQDTVAGDMTLTAQWKAAAAAAKASGEGKQPGGTGSSGGAGGTSGSGEGTLDSAVQALTDAANGLKKILTGDKAPLTYAVTGIFLSAAALIWLLKKRFK